MKYPKPFLFLQGFLKNPKRVGSLFPNQRFLAKKIIREIPWNNIKSIAELGAGTGAITRLFTGRLQGNVNVFLFERDKKMRENLRDTYPQFKLHSNASYLSKKLIQESINHLDCIICGLPFFNFSKNMRENIIHQMVHSLKPGGILIVYQNTLHMKKKWAEHLVIDKIIFEPFNLAPAFIFVCHKKDQPSA
ncbi:methyltransferase domain-containing protein [Paenibacillus sp. JJ-223]|uniref:class I SAM-dependent methyltransferase n=1 Tax=Paenibacillus sp. JJ-223 TaxID=2905647 RepID=UPI001F317257|nr:methyltransferase domain-containing protein [Paenibacillus sp. JJ-223]CAH1191125.1 Ornithine lipid N-methyltransferase [Paenibacillus sp. JJ-223]